jgi:hypothetical protein
MNSEEIFSIALGLKAPWFVSHIMVDQTTNPYRVEIEIGYDKSHEMFKDDDGKSIIYDNHERKWRHLNFFQHECYLKCEVPRVKRGEKVETIEVPWARPGSGFTLMFEAYSMLLIEN